MQIKIIPQLSDNYAYLISAGASGEAAIIDPAEADKVLEAVEAAGLELTTILNTHHHWDHTGGNEGLLAIKPDLRVVGFAPDAERIPGITERVNDGDTVKIGGIEGQVMCVPCHTNGHIAYRFADALFTGDTLFAGGCGRFFEGTAKEMHRALIDVIGALPDETRIYCGHEYTESNLRFALHVEADNPAVSNKMDAVKALRAAGEPSIPTTLGEERSYNPFMRPDAAGIKSTIGRLKPGTDLDDPIGVLGALRDLKDDF